MHSNTNSFFRNLLPWIAVIALFAIGSSANASDAPFDNPANWGGTGLMEIPTARILDDGVIRAGHNRSLPYIWTYAAMGVFPGLEVDLRYTELDGVEGGLGEDFGDYKDKALDLKILHSALSFINVRLAGDLCCSTDMEAGLPVRS